MCFHYITGLDTSNNKPVTLHICSAALFPLLCTTVPSNAKVFQIDTLTFFKYVLRAQACTDLEAMCTLQLTNLLHHIFIASQSSYSSKDM